MKKNSIIVAILLIGLSILIAIICYKPKNRSSVSSNSMNEIIELDINVYDNGNVSDNSTVTSEDDELIESKIITIDEETGEIEEETIILDSSETPIIAVKGGDSDSKDQETTTSDEVSGDNPDIVTSSVETSDTGDDKADSEVYINEDGEIVLPFVPID